MAATIGQRATFGRRKKGHGLQVIPPPGATQVEVRQLKTPMG